MALTLHHAMEPSPTLTAVGKTQVRGKGAASTTPTVEELFQAHGSFILRQIRRLGVAEADTEDAAQEVFLVAHRKLRALSPEANPRAWLFGIGRRVAADFRKKRRRKRETALIDLPAAETTADQQQVFERRQARQLLDKALGQLDAKRREVFILRELEGLSMQEVATTVGCPLKTAYARLYRARETVTKYLRRQIGGGGTPCTMNRKSVVW